MSFFSNPFKSIKKIVKKVKPFALPLIGAALAPFTAGTSLAISPAAGAAIGSGISSYSSNHNLGQALASAGGSYAGANLGGQLLGNLGTVGGGLQSALGPDLGSFIGQSVLPGALNFAPISSILGSQIGSNLASSLIPQKTANNVGPSVAAATTVTPFNAKREAEQNQPASFRSFGTLTPQQLSSNIATGGVYGGGQGPDEQSYFLNMLNRRLVDDTGQVDTNLSEVSPIEGSYLSQLGLGGYGNAKDLLEAISRRRMAA